MPTVAFDNWVTEALIITLAGREYRLAPPSVEQAKTLIVLYKHMFATELSDDEQAIMDRVGNLPMEQAGLPGDVYAQLCADGVAKDNISRMAIYNILYFVGDKTVADSFANTLWTKIQAADESKAKAKVGSGPKGKPTSPKRTGTPTGSVSKTPTRASTKTTGSQLTSGAPTKTPARAKSPGRSGGRTGLKSADAGELSKLTS